LCGTDVNAADRSDLGNDSSLLNSAAAIGGGGKSPMVIVGDGRCKQARRGVERKRLQQDSCMSLGVVRHKGRGRRKCSQGSWWWALE